MLHRWHIRHSPALKGLPDPHSRCPNFWQIPILTPLALALFSSGASVLVLEKSRQLYRADPPEACWGWAQKEYPENTGAVTVAESGSKSLCFRNMSGCALKCVVVLFKNFDAESGMYIGGISYPVRAENLAAGEERVVSPYKYVRNYSRVVYLSVDIE